MKDRRIVSGDVASESDRKWFKAHPGETERVRLSFPGELHYNEGFHLVSVTQIRPGHRVRTGFNLPVSETFRPFSDIPVTIDSDMPFTREYAIKILRYLEEHPFWTMSLCDGYVAFLPKAPWTTEQLHENGATLAFALFLAGHHEDINGDNGGSNGGKTKRDRRR